MLLTRHFVYVHVPKTGGNFVRRILEQHAPADWQLRHLDDHATFEQIPESHRELPRIAFARNPFSWYVSWFHYQQQARDDFFLRISDGGRLGFADTIWNAFTGSGPLAGSAGALTTTLLEMLGQGLVGARVGKMESIRDDLVRLLGACTELPAAMTAAIQAVPPQNQSRHAHFSTYYDDELRALVRAKDAPVFDFFGYEWEAAPSGGAD